MTKSEEALMEALLPCGKDPYHEYSIVGERTFKIHKKLCCDDNCPKRLNNPREACGFENVFRGSGFTCPVDN